MEIYQCRMTSQVYRYQRIGVESWALSADLERPMTFVDAWGERPGTVGTINVNGLQAPGYAATGACATGVVFGVGAVRRWTHRKWRSVRDWRDESWRRVWKILTAMGGRCGCARDGV